MKRYLFGVTAVILALALNAFTKPVKTSRVNYYSFAYLAPGGSYAEADVENENVAHWGYGTQISSPTDFPASCTQINIDERACEIAVTEAETVLVIGVGRRLRTAADGPSNQIIINAKTANLHPNTYMVDAPASPSIDGVANGDY